MKIVRIIFTVLFIFSASNCNASDEKSKTFKEVYGNCNEIEESVFNSDEGINFLKSDMANFGWNYEDIAKELKGCKLPIIPKEWLE